MTKNFIIFWVLKEEFYYIFWVFKYQGVKKWQSLVSKWTEYYASMKSFSLRGRGGIRGVRGPDEDVLDVLQGNHHHLPTHTFGFTLETPVVFMQPGRNGWKHDIFKREMRGAGRVKLRRVGDNVLRKE